MMDRRTFIGRVASGLLAVLAAVHPAAVQRIDTRNLASTAAGWDRYATFAKVRATMVGIVTDPRGDATLTPPRSGMW